MKLIFQISIFITMLALSGCNVYAHKTPESTSSARAAYGDTMPEFKANKKKNQKRKKKARKQAKRKKSVDNKLYFHGRPY